MAASGQVKSTAVAVLEFLVARNVFVEKQELFLHPEKQRAPSAFTKQLYALMVGVLEVAATRDADVSVSVPGCSLESNSTECTVLIPGTSSFDKETLGCRVSVLPPISLSHSFALWIRRPRRDFDDLMEEVMMRLCEDADNHLSKLSQIGRKLIGRKVLKEWKQDQSLGSLGIIQDFDAKKRSVIVEWQSTKDPKKPEKVKKSHAFGALVDGGFRFEVTLADESIIGKVYSKGMKQFQSADKQDARLNAFGLNLCADGSLEYFVGLDADNTAVQRTDVRLGPDVWTHVCVVRDNAKYLLYVDGKVAGEELSLEDKEGEKERALASYASETPLYIGQPPFYINNSGDVESSFEGSVHGLCLFGMKALSADDISELMENRPPHAVTQPDELFSLQALGLIRKECLAFRDFTSLLLLDEFSLRKVLGPLFGLLKHGSSATQCAVLRLCASLLPSFSREAVDKAAVHCDLIGSSCLSSSSSPSSFLDFVFNELGHLMSSQAEYDPVCPARPCSEVDNALGVEYANLLCSLAATPSWDEHVGTVFEMIVSGGIQTKSTSVLAVLAMCGGDLFGLCGGASARYQMSGSGGETGAAEGGGGGMLEDCTIIAPAWPPTQQALEEKWRGREAEGEAKAEFALWENRTAFSEAFYVTLYSQPLTPTLVPRDKLFPVAATRVLKAEAFVKSHLTSLVGFFRDVIGADAITGEGQAGTSPSTQTSHVKLLGMMAFRTLLQSFPWFAMASARVLRSLVDVTLIPVPVRPVPPAPPKIKPVTMESKHDYDHNANDYFPIKFPGAKSLKVVFDPETRTERNYDYMKFYKDDSHTDQFGDEKYTGGRGSWPGTGSNPPLIIPSDSCVIYWRTDSSGNDWGWRLTISVESYKVSRQVRGCT
jgi:hypothetical protein